MAEMNDRFADSAGNWSDRELSAWLDEMLPVERMTELESDLRDSEDLRDRVASLIRHRDQGGHTVGEIWHRERLSCPSRSELSGFLLKTLTDEHRDYISFHLTMVGCRICLANLNDLQESAAQADGAPARRRRFFESSAGLLTRSDEPIGE